MFDKLISQIQAYEPYNEQERVDKEVTLDYMRNNEDIFLRTNLKAHMTASAWIVNKDRTHVLMIYHNIYDSWAWTGGHADGDQDLLAVAVREAKEETGVDAFPVSEDIYSIELLNVHGHIKRGAYVPCHMHINVTYLLEADDSIPVRAKTDENKAVQWFDLDQVLKMPSKAEQWMTDNIYSKLNAKLFN